MRVLIAGGRGFLGSALATRLRQAGHRVVILGRRVGRSPGLLHWDGKAGGPWTDRLEEVDAVVNATGYGLEHWPWSASRKRRFVDSRVLPGRALADAILKCRRRPLAFIQYSGINRYGLGGEGIADESAPPGDDFLARLTVEWEAATRVVEDAGVRWIAVRNAIVLDADGGLLPLMILPLRLFVGGRVGSGAQPVPWIHLEDQVQAVRFLLENSEARGAYNLVAPTLTSNDEFMRTAARILRRPYWLPVPAGILRLVLGEMSSLLLDGRQSVPRRILELGFRFAHPEVESALHALLGGNVV